MSKYASGTSMKTVILSEMAEVEKVLTKNNLSEEDKEIILDALKEFVYQWCSLNATSRATEEATVKLYGEKALVDIFRETVISGVREKVFEETYPFD